MNNNDTQREMTLREYIDSKPLNENHLIKKQLLEYERQNKDELSASEALFGFCGWLTTRKEVTEMGSTKECSTIVDKISDFCKVNNLQEPRNGWQNSLMHPVQKPPK